jgi:hypothetical protein
MVSSPSRREGLSGMTASRRCGALIALILLPATAVATARPLAGTAPGPRVVVRVPELTAAPVAVQSGGTLTLAGRGFPGDVHVVLMAGPPHGEASRIGGAVTGRRGRFTATIRIRPGSRPGRFVALACHDSCAVKASASFRIVAP